MLLDSKLPRKFNFLNPILEQVLNLPLARSLTFLHLFSGYFLLSEAWRNLVLPNFPSPTWVPVQLLFSLSAHQFFALPIPDYNFFQRTCKFVTISTVLTTLTPLQISLNTYYITSHHFLPHSLSSSSINSSNTTTTRVPIQPIQLSQPTHISLIQSLSP